MTVLLQVSVFCHDATYLATTKGRDAQYRQSTFSGPLGHGACLKVSTCVTPDGLPVAVSPGEFGLLHSQCTLTVFFYLQCSKNP